MCGFKTVAEMVRNIHDAMGITVPVALHLDHGTYEGTKACIEAGFTSVMAVNGEKLDQFYWVDYIKVTSDNIDTYNK